MGYKYWGYVLVIGNVWTQRGDTAESVTEGINPALLPDWIKNKIAMLDLINERTELPCGSFKTVYPTSTAWIIYEDVSSTRESEARERSVDRKSTSLLRGT